MKVIFIILISSLTLFSQTDKAVGDYAFTVKTVENNLFEYKMSLFQDGTFFFHYYSNIKQGVPPEVNKYGKGEWIMKNNVISFFCDKQKDIDEKHTLDFTNTKARFVIKSPRDKTDQIIKTKLTFLESDIFWIKRLNIVKI